jgi:molybdopterin molybdotransferase
LAENAGGEAHLAKRVPDSAENLRLVLQAAIKESDVVLISGGSSVGDRDFTTTVVQELPDVQILFHGIAWKPGKPTLMALAGQTVVFGLPGHTVAAMTVFQELVAPVLYACQGAETGMSKFVVAAELGAPLRPDRERDEIIRVRLEQGSDKVVAWPLPAKSGLITTMSRAHGIVHTKAGQEPLQAGDKIKVQIIMDRVDGIWQGVAR